MSKYTCIIVPPNSFDATKYDSIKSLIDATTELCTMESAESTHMGKLIVDTLQMNHETVADTMTMFQTHDYVIDMCHVAPEQNKEDPDEEQLNAFATYCAIEQSKIYGTVVFLLSTVTDMDTCIMEDITLDHMHRMVVHRYQHKAVMIPVDGNVYEFIYKDNPIEHLPVDEQKTTSYVDSTLCKFNIVAFFPIYADNINKRATRLLNRRVYGDVIISLRSSERIFEDIDKELYEKLNNVSWGNSEKRNLTEEENKDGEKKDGLPIVMNRHRILEKRQSNNYLKCTYCSNDIEKRIVCSGCYRALYRTPECQKADWLAHRKDCLYRTESLNSIAQKRLEECKDSE